jgi:phosphotransferase system HPr (HPr) family protein
MGNIVRMIAEREVVEATLTVGNRLGLHARVATMMVQSMRNYSCQVTLRKDGVEVDARSVLGLLLLAASPGSEIVVRAQGPDSREAIQEISRLIQDEDSEEN